ncbi:stage III sporulation protein AB [Seinonella peptonophila]|uniref:Stage III sporulation protein AB n=1 Tax=Seinonella peptonophila TaxID=112248 RepID=A0A1M4TMW6_9BACL|nr:stage III sporulation protein SpoIIIAB [Seinonella peptonophila]SHE45823.1 stage III sporulation protein AB [Seinonella peptonophila]
MLKLVGSFITVLTSTWLGFHLAMQVRQRPKQIRQLLTAFSLLRSEIQYGNRPLFEICKLISVREIDKIADIFRFSYEELQKNEGDTTYHCFHKAIRQVWGQTSLKGTEKEIFLDLCSVLGRSDRLDQIQHIDRAKEQLQVVEEKARLEQEQYEKMFRTMGVLGGVLVVILLY